MADRFTIVDVRAHVVDAADSGGDYHKRSSGHWIADTLIANPMSVYADYRARRTSWGIGALGSVVVEIESADGTIGVATGMGADPACYLIEKHFRRFLIGADARDTARLWDQMFRASMFYGRKGLAMTAVSVVDLALWDLVGRLRGEPVYRMIGGAVRDELTLYCTGPDPARYREQGFFGAKIPLPEGPADGPAGLKRNVEVIAAARAAVGPDFPLMIDCYMALDVPYAIALAEAVRPLGVYWLEEVLHPDDFDGHRTLKAACPWMRWTTGEHEYTRYGFRNLIAARAVDIVQPDVMWCGGLTELIRIAALANAYDIPVVPHGSGAYSYHFCITQPQAIVAEYINISPDGRDIVPVFGGMFRGESLPRNGAIRPGEAPGFGLDLDRDAVRLRRPYPA
ncbi:MAG: L-rhamnonate dehydratase [Methylobacteriaceae bacterium]|nr:L-rhamnonate dehydratase [Methylobacteriaceae bacterium]